MSLRGCCSVTVRVSLDLCSALPLNRHTDVCVLWIAFIEPALEHSSWLLSVGWEHPRGRNHSR